VEHEGYRAREYSTFEKGELLIEMAKRDPEVANTLKGTDKGAKRKLFARAGLSEGEVKEALEHIDRAFGKGAVTAVFW